MAHSGRAPRLIIAVSAALLIGYAGFWAHVSHVQIGRSDFTNAYVGGTLLREGHRADLYDDQLQGALHAQLIAPDKEGNLPFVDAPVAAAIVLPLTWLDLGTAFRVWSLVEFAVLVFAVVVAIRAAPWPAGTRQRWKAAAGAAALAGAGTVTMWLQAQWTPIVALGLAAAFWLWRGDRLAAGSAVLVASAAIAKPHLALGVFAFMLGWRNRRVVAGAVAGALAVAVASLAVVGTGGIAGFIGVTIGGFTRWELRVMPSFAGIAGTYLGTGGAAMVAAAAGALGACAAAWWLGSRVRQDRGQLGIALCGATVLSLLAAPHAYAHDLVLLAPVLVWSVAVATPPASTRVAVRSPLAAVFSLWACLTGVELLDPGITAPVPPGEAAALVLIGAATLACAAVHIRYRASREATLGAVADDVRRRRPAE
ncbi:MAG: glycosyltransferase 87 family protein [Candidatus Dormibacteria bacterium]